MSHQSSIPEADLHAFVDDRLAGARRAEVEQYLASSADEAARVAAYRRQNDALKRMFDPVLTEPIPAGLRAAARAPGARHPTAWTFRIAAAAGWLALGAAAGWFGRDAFPRAGTASVQVAAAPANPFVFRAARAHATYVPEKRHAVEVPANQEAHLVTWLSKRLGKPLKIPSLTEQGYALVGGRLLPGDDGPAAQFMYEDPRGGRLTLYLKTESKSSDTAFRYAEENGVSVFYWVDGAFGYALSGTVDKARLLEIANVVFHNIKG